MFHGRLVNAHVEVLKRERTTEQVRCFEDEIRPVNNLVGSAIDATPTANRLLFSDPHHSPGQTGIILTIADSGSGMPHAVQEKIFDPFFTTKGSGGTGLGLRISCEIVKRHKGQMTVRSSQRQGSSGTAFRLSCVLTMRLSLEHRAELSST